MGNSCRRHVSAELHWNMLFLTTASAESNRNYDSGEQDGVFHGQSLLQVFVRPKILHQQIQSRIAVIHARPQSGRCIDALCTSAQLQALSDSRRQSHTIANVSGLRDQG
jgi:hypothetical protein